MRLHAGGARRDDPPATPDRRVRRWIAIVVLAHALGVALLFDPLSGLWNDRPLVEQDYGLHFHHLRSMESLWEESGRLWGYNPLFMAGYPSNTIQDLSIKLFEIGAMALRPLGAVRAFKLLIFGAVALLPWIYGAAARLLCAPAAEAEKVGAVAACASAAYWWNSLPREMFFFGMVGFSVGVYAALLVLGLLRVLMRAPSGLGRRHFAWLAGLVVLLPLHLQAPLILLVPATVLLASARAWRDYRVWAWMGTGILVALAINAFWLFPFFAHQANDASTQILESLPILTRQDPLFFLRDYFGSSRFGTFRPQTWEKTARLFILIAGVAGVAGLFRRGNRDLAVALGGGTATLFALTYFGSFSPFLLRWQVLRFEIALDLMLLLPASWLGVQLWQRRRTAWRPFLLGAGATAAVAVVLIANVASTESAGRLRLRSEIPAHLEPILDWIGERAPRDGRVLFEESGDETGFRYAGVYLSSFVPDRTGHELIGGPINLYNDRHHFAEFHSGLLFKRKIGTLDDQTLADYFRAYNIGAIVAFSPESVERLMALPGVRLERRVGPIHLLRVQQPLSWLLEGEARIRARLGAIRVEGARGESLVLKYHWHPRMVAEPAARVEPYPILDDPIPFVRVVDPPPEFTLRLR